jgi:hypothetical protein
MEKVVVELMLMEMEQVVVVKLVDQVEVDQVEEDSLVDLEFKVQQILIHG